MERRPAFRFHTPSSLMIAGPSGSGKTVFTTKLLLDNPEFFADPPPDVHYCYGSWQKGFDKLKKAGDQFHEGIPHSDALPQCLGPRRSDGRRTERQRRVGSLHQTLASSEHHRDLPVSGSVSERKIRQDHFPQCPLHHGIQESQRSIGDAQSAGAIVSHTLARGDGDVSKGD